MWSAFAWVHAGHTAVEGPAAVIWTGSVMSARLLPRVRGGPEGADRPRPGSSVLRPPRPVPLSGSNPSVTSTLTPCPPHGLCAFPFVHRQTDPGHQQGILRARGAAGCGPARAAGSSYRDDFEEPVFLSPASPSMPETETLTVGRVHSQPALAPGASDLKTRCRWLFLLVLPVA